jgi:predicted Rossmann-fold nucleotide-binding protein
MSKTICVYCSSSAALDPSYYQAAQELGLLMAQQNCTVVYGGSRIRLMVALARAATTWQQNNWGNTITVTRRSPLQKNMLYIKKNFFY